MNLAEFSVPPQPSAGSKVQYSVARCLAYCTTAQAIADWVTIIAAGTVERQAVAKAWAPSWARCAVRRPAWT